jgi:hypothetical protein
MAPVGPHIGHALDIPAGIGTVPASRFPIIFPLKYSEGVVCPFLAVCGEGTAFAGAPHLARPRSSPQASSVARARSSP